MPGTRSDTGVDETTAKRKDSHLDLCLRDAVEPEQNDTLFGQVKLIHCAMPELQVSEIELGTTWFGKRLKAPLLITGMTGGTDRACLVNRQLAQVAEEFGLAFGVGSQRAMAERPGLTETFRVRDVAPTALLLGNVGLVQAVRMGADGLQRLMEAIEADAIAIHLNPGQELTQPEGDRDFRFGYDTITKVAKALGPRLLVKETGCGLSPEVAKRLVECGVSSLDVSGLGGTSWVRVEQLRSEGAAAEVGKQFSGWGIPTAAAVASVRAAVPQTTTLIASGGVRTGLEVAKALALGASLGGMALPFFRAQQQGGVAGVRAAVELVLSGLRQAFALTGSKNAAALRAKPKVLGSELREWLTALSAAV